MLREYFRVCSAKGGHRNAPPSPTPSALRVRESIDLPQSLRSMVQTHGPSLQRLGIRLELALADEPVRVFAAPADLRDLLDHIVAIASGALPGGCALQVLARVDGHHAVINWRDIGDEAPRLALAFENVGRPIAARVLTCQAIAARYGARLYAAPSPLGDRSLTVRFPLHACP